MSKRLAIALSCSLMAYLITGMVAAQPGAGQGMGPAGQGRMTERFRSMDANSDGFISVDEIDAQHESMFSTMDANDDGVLAENEYTAMPMGGGGGMNPRKQEQMQMRKGKRFKAMDIDGDGKVTREEFVGVGRKQFQAMDTNGDLKVDVEEFRAGHRGKPVK
jgi:Ca2+-binding EF-hand superfamily protein